MHHHDDDNDYDDLNNNNKRHTRQTYNFQFGDGHNQDFRGCPSSFAATARKFWDSITVTARALCIACSVALDLPSDYFLSALRSNASSTIRLLHYPSCTFTPSAAAGGGAIRAGEHTDFGLFTFLFTDGTGLQARANKSSELEEVDGNGRKGEWIDVDFPPPKSETTTSIVVLGALMSRWTNDAWPAAAHRVIVPDEIQARMNRLTIACFFQPDPEFIVSVHPNFVSQENPSKYKPIKAFDYLSVRLEHAKASVPESELEQETNGI